MKRLIRKIGNMNSEQAKIKMYTLLSNKAFYFNKEQQEEIMQGFIDGLTNEEILEYCDENLSAEDMRSIRLKKTTNVPSNEISSQELNNQELSKKELEIKRNKSSNQESKDKLKQEIEGYLKDRGYRNKDESYKLIDEELTDEEIDYLLSCYKANQFIANNIFNAMSSKKITNLNQFKKITDYLFTHFDIDKNYGYINGVIFYLITRGISEKKLKVLMDESLFNDMPFFQSYVMLEMIKQMNDSDFEPETFVKVIKEVIKNTSESSIPNKFNDWRKILDLITKSTKENIDIIPYLSIFKTLKKVSDDVIELILYAAQNQIDVKDFDKYKNLSKSSLETLQTISKSVENGAEKDYLDICLKNINKISNGQIKSILDAIKRNIPFDEFKKYMKFSPSEVIRMNELKQSILEENSQEALEIFNGMMRGDGKQTAKEYRKNHMEYIRFLDKLKN